jgi:hypothetical protein
MAILYYILEIQLGGDKDDFYFEGNRENYFFGQAGDTYSRRYKRMWWLRFGDVVAQFSGCGGSVG